MRFRIFADKEGVRHEAKYQTVFKGNSVEYLPVSTTSVDLVVGRTHGSLSERFKECSPIFRFEDGSYLDYDMLVVPQTGPRQLFERERIEIWDWRGIDLGKESQSVNRYPDSIQYRVIERLKNPSRAPQYDIIFDDDDAGEVADIVAIKRTESQLLVHLYHCKYSKRAEPGRRVGDLYEVCGQAQRSAYWRNNIKRMIERLICREQSRKDAGKPTRFEVGDVSKLYELSRRLPDLLAELEFKVFIVQPGLSKQQAEDGQLDLLAVTELYLRETAASPFAVIASS